MDPDGQIPPRGAGEEPADGKIENGLPLVELAEHPPDERPEWIWTQARHVQTLSRRRASCRANTGSRADGNPAMTETGTASPVTCEDNSMTSRERMDIAMHPG